MTDPEARVFGGPDGHGRYGILDRRPEDGRLLCHECGRWWHHLGTHVAGGHGMTAAHYRAVHGLSTGTALIGTRVHTKLAAASSRPERLAQLAEIRNPDHARTRMTREAQWAPELVAARIARGRARRVGLTAEQVAELGEPDRCTRMGTPGTSTDRPRRGSSHRDRPRGRHADGDRVAAATPPREPTPYVVSPEFPRQNRS